MLKIIFLFITLHSLTASLQAQSKIGIGASIVHNIPLSSTGFGLRADIPVFSRLHVVPQVKYMPAFNPITEFYGGINLHLIFFKWNKLNVYAAGGVQFNRWLNYTESLNGKAKETNFLPEAGLGAFYGGRLIGVFAEFKYNILWNESYAEVGFLFFPGNLKRGHYICPTYY